MAFVCLCICLCALPRGVVGKDPSTTPLTQWPMIFAHDAATSYLPGGLLHQINDWTKTQPSGGFKKMLECGARAFDVRPYRASNTSDTITFHHGPIHVNKDFAEVLID